MSSLLSSFFLSLLAANFSNRQNYFRFIFFHCAFVFVVCFCVSFFCCVQIFALQLRSDYLCLSSLLLNLFPTFRSTFYVLSFAQLQLPFCETTTSMKIQKKQQNNKVVEVVESLAFCLARSTAHLPLLCIAFALFIGVCLV